MPDNFDLIITVAGSLLIDLQLRDAHGSQIAYRQTDFSLITASNQRGLFDLHDYLLLFVEENQQVESMAAIGVCIAQELLGEEIFNLLWASQAQRTIRIQLPNAATYATPLAALLPRIPWKIARRSLNQSTLAERNLLVRIVHDVAEPATEALSLSADEPLRVLFVFAGARGSQPLESRREHQKLQQLFEKEIYPKRQIIAHFLSYGVTRERLTAQIRENSGYHLVHWSGHGGHNTLELAHTGGEADYISGTELANLFITAGGFLPRLFFLSACQSGDLLRVQDWQEFLAIAQGQQVMSPLNPDAINCSDLPVVQASYTGTAHALLYGGVPSVVAMRYAVGDVYARELAVRFYKALLAYQQPMSVVAALTTARQQLLPPISQSRIAPCDHATPILYGAEQLGFSFRSGRSPALDSRTPRLHQISELMPQEHKHFVGRTWELTKLGSDFIGTGVDVLPVAIITGLGGMGKTALVAEALSLWEREFEWVLLYQAKPRALQLESTLSDIHSRLYGELGYYHQHIQKHPADAIYRAPSVEFTGKTRLDRLTRNLIRALRDESILLVLDNFEANLKPNAEVGSITGWTCQDPAWDECLTQLAAELISSHSRVLITCRRPLVALPSNLCCNIALGPLPKLEAALYLREHEGLKQMVFGGVETEQQLAFRLLQASQFHPLLMSQLARLATGDPALRPQLLQILASLENSGQYSALPALFADERGYGQEQSYLEDALIKSICQLIEYTSPDGRRLLWIIALANNPPDRELLTYVWRGENPEYRELEQMRSQLQEQIKNKSHFSFEAQAKLADLVRDFEKLDKLPSLPVRPSIDPLLGYLLSVGLITEEYIGSEADATNHIFVCHELVQEQIFLWMEKHINDRADLTENVIRLSYAEWLVGTFKLFLHKNVDLALQAGNRALVFYIQVEAYEQLLDFAGKLINSSVHKLDLLAVLITQLQIASTRVPEGKLRWSILGFLADALRLSGQEKASLPYYEEANNQATAAAKANTVNAAQDWNDVSWIIGNWINALIATGNLPEARQRAVESYDANVKANRVPLELVASKLNQLYISMKLGQYDQPTREIRSLLTQLKGWWNQYAKRQQVPEAPDKGQLAHALALALDIAIGLDIKQNDWDAVLKHNDTILMLEKSLGRSVEALAFTRINRAIALKHLRRFPQAQAELEDCLKIFQNNPSQKSVILSTLATIFHAQNDLPQAIIQQRRCLALRSQTPDPEKRVDSHSNLALYLIQSGRKTNLIEGAQHRLAALLYSNEADIKDKVVQIVYHYYSDYNSSGVLPFVPRIDDLLKDSAFNSLKEWLQERHVDIPAFQSFIDNQLKIK